MAISDGTDGPPYDEPREQIQYGGQIQLATLADDELGRVPDPPSIRTFRRKRATEQVGGDRLIVIAHRRARVPLPRPGDQAVFLHQADHSLAAHRLLLPDQVLVDAWTAVAAFALRERRPHEHLQPTILPRARRVGPSTPRVEPTARHRQTSH
jgi:hypothetical protein